MKEMGSSGASLGCSVILLLLGSCFATFNDNFTTEWSPENILPDEATNSVKLTMTEVAGARFASKDSFLFGSFSVKIKLIAGESAGTVCSFYLNCYSDHHDEIDFEFLGNETGQPYGLHTNIHVNGVGGREQQIFLWFDPTADFHTYSLIWNHHQITWLVDDIPIRIHKNIEDVLPNSYPTSQPLTVLSSIFDASNWATRGGRVHTNYTYAPFVVEFKDFAFGACKASSTDISACTNNYEQNWWEAVEQQSLDPTRMNQLKDVHRNYMIYDYCTDQTRNPSPPEECSYNTV